MMVKVCKNGVWILKGREIIEDCPENQARLKNLPPLAGLTGRDAVPDGTAPAVKDAGRRGSITAEILLAHHQAAMQAGAHETAGLPKELKLTFDAMTSHDITFVNIIQTAKVSGLEEFPIPYILTNCHNSLCAVGGTVNADDHLFGLSAAKRYGGIFVPPHMAVMHSYMRETQAGCGKMILGSDSHTRYGALGTMGVGEGGGELVKQLLRQTYDLQLPKVIAVYFTGKPRRGVGPQDVALAIIGAVFNDGFAKNAVLEFLGDGIGEMSADFRCGIDVMTTETACWSSIWETDETVRSYFVTHGREGDYKKLFPGNIAYYDGMIYADLSSIKPMIALPFHPSNAYELDELLSNPADIFSRVEKDAAGLMENPEVKLKLLDKIDEKGRIRIDQAVVAGCAGGTFDNIMAVRSILESGAAKSGPDKASDNEGFALSVYPGSQPILLELVRNGAYSSLISRGAVTKTAFCGPCFGAGDVPANNGLSIRHTTRNFPNREGSKPGQGQISAVCLMDARSIAATALNGGYLASAAALDWEERPAPYRYDPAPYLLKAYNGAGKPDKNTELRYGPNITDWPPMDSLGENLLVKIISYITDPVTTTDELIPSGETSSFRSNPVGLAEFTLSRKDPAYVGKARAVKEASAAFRAGGAERAAACLPELAAVLAAVKGIRPAAREAPQLGSAIFAKKPDDGSAREQAASCQRVLGGAANFAGEYATKRYRSNLINWGILPFIVDGEPPFKNGDYVYIPGVAAALRESAGSATAYVIAGDNGCKPFALKIPVLSPAERELILAGSLINYNRALPREKAGG
jgi:aconitate hydratase